MFSGRVPSPRPAQTSLMSDRDRMQVTCWLSICVILVFSMVLLGGAVRLTGSGLSMVDWKPLTGIIPPMTESDWAYSFKQYQQYPEFKLVNKSISLSEFRFIYYMEYAHRLLGRIIGLVFFIPFIVFLYSGKLCRQLRDRLWLLFFMGAIQGGMGWYMVKSGLADNPAVSQYRLVSHLLIAVLIYGYMVRIIVGLRAETCIYKGATKILGISLLTATAAMIGSGGFVAGTRAGFIYNTFPMMAGSWIPPRLMDLTPWWINIFENPVTVQFAHRYLAVIVLLLAVGYAYSLFTHSDKTARRLSAAVGLAVIVQVVLGISALLLKVPLGFGIAHQGGALVLFGAVIAAVFRGCPGICPNSEQTPAA